MTMLDRSSHRIVMDSDSLLEIGAGSSSTIVRRRAPGKPPRNRRAVGLGDNTPHRVRALFTGASLAFNLPRRATFGDLARELLQLGRRYGGAPLYIDVKLRS